MKLENKESFFTLDGECDKKNKLLRSNASLTAEEMKKIDSGKLTLEDLEILVSKKAKIFKYQTQITIHAAFPRQVENRVNGYAYLTNNKNGSIGIRYGAIDEIKRENLEHYLLYEGFHYNKNSTNHDFVLTKRFSNREDAVQYIAGLKNRYDYNAIRKLIYGGIDIYGGVYWGMYYVFLRITVNAIPENNILEFLKLMECKSGNEIKAIEEENRKKQEKKSQEYERERLKRQAKEAEDTKTKRHEILEFMLEKHKQISKRPVVACNLCIVTDNARLVVIKQFCLKNGNVVTKKFLQRDYGMQDFQKWNNIIPSHSAKDTSRIDDTVIERYINEGAAFSL